MALVLKEEIFLNKCLHPNISLTGLKIIVQSLFDDKFLFL